MSEYDAKQAVAVADARDAVIEAAKAWWADIKAGDYYYPVDSIGKAVEALEKAEGE